VLVSVKYNNRPDGSRYEGEWSKGEMHGNGIKILENGEQVFGRWAKSEFINKLEPSMMFD